MPPEENGMVRAFTFALALLLCAFAPFSLIHAQAPSAADPGPWEEVGKTGFGTKRLVLASACTEACPWGELGDFLKEAMAPEGYDIILCRNCNRTEGPRIV